MFTHFGVCLFNFAFFLSKIISENAPISPAVVRDKAAIKSESVNKNE